MLLGFVGLLVTVAIVALVARVQLRQGVAMAPAAASAVEGSDTTTSVPVTRDLPRKIQDDLTRAMQQAPARDDESR